MSDARSGSPDPRGDSGGARGSSDFQGSVARLERAVNELVDATRAQVSDRTTALIDETTRRLERELDRRRSTADPGERHAYRSHIRERNGSSIRSRRLCRDPARRRIVGVCAGIARYYGVEPWVVRCIAVTGLLFFPTIVFPAYWIAYFVMDRPAPAEPEADPGRRRRGRRHRCGNRSDARHGRHDHRSPAPELGPRLSPRYSLRNVQADLAEVELRLRRMETHVTSGQYELQRELNRIEGGDHERGR